jgi:hypothetical protein
VFSWRWGWVRPKRGCLLTLAYYAFPRWYKFEGRRWNDILTRENRKTRRKTCPSATLSTINPTWIEPGVNPGLRGERPATKNLSYGTANRHSYITRDLVLSTPDQVLQGVPNFLLLSGQEHVLIGQKDQETSLGTTFEHEWPIFGIFNKSLLINRG